MYLKVLKPITKVQFEAVGRMGMLGLNIANSLFNDFLDVTLELVWSLLLNYSFVFEE